MNSLLIQFRHACLSCTNVMLATFCACPVLGLRLLKRKFLPVLHIHVYGFLLMLADGRYPSNACPPGVG